MRGKTLLIGTLLGTVCVASASAAPPEARTVVLVVQPETAAIAVDGHPRQHRNGVVELRGPLGSVFTVEAVANGSTIIQRVAVTDVGALPARLVVPPTLTPVITQPAPVIAPDVCSAPFWHDAQGVKHYKPQCLAMEYDAQPRRASCDLLTAALQSCLPATASAASAAAEPTPRPAPPTPTSSEEVGFLTIASYPWSRVWEGGRTLCITPCVKLALPGGTHLLTLENDASGVKQTISVNITPGETTTKRIAFR